MNWNLWEWSDPNFLYCYPFHTLCCTDCLANFYSWGLTVKWHWNLAGHISCTYPWLVVQLVRTPGNESKVMSSLLRGPILLCCIQGLWITPPITSNVLHYVCYLLQERFMWWCLERSKQIHVHSWGNLSKCMCARTESTSFSLEIPVALCSVFTCPPHSPPFLTAGQWWGFPVGGERLLPNHMLPLYYTHSDESTVITLFFQPYVWILCFNWNH